ncbi:unnamed protein product, partial [Rotaria magnacalcarata]
MYFVEGDYSHATPTKSLPIYTSTSSADIISSSTLSYVSSPFDSLATTESND